MFDSCHSDETFRVLDEIAYHSRLLTGPCGFESHRTHCMVPADPLNGTKRSGWTDRSDKAIVRRFDSS